MGHTEADAAAGRAAIAAGAGLLTHALNAMRGIASREPSALAAFLAHPRARVSLIGDGVHVAPGGRGDRGPGRRAPPDPRERRGRRGRRAAGHLPPGRAHDHVRRPARDAPAGRLAGSALGIDRGPATLAGAGIARGAALSAAIDAPRRLLGLPPALAPGSPADVVVLDPDLVPRLTLVGGRVAFADPDLPFEV